VRTDGWGFVEQQPVHPELPRRLGESGEVDGFADVAVGSEVIAADHVLLFV